MEAIKKLAEKLFAVTLIVTHLKPHFDEWVAILLLRAFGEKFFPGIAKAQIVYRDAGSTPDGGMTAEDAEAAGILAVGVWGGRFDEHATEDRERRREDCAATLVAKFLGVENDPGLEPILKYILARDSGKMPKEAGGGVGDLYRLVDAIYEANPDDPVPALEVMSIAFNALLANAIRWNTVTGGEYARVAKFYDLAGSGGKTLKLVVLDGVENDQLNRYARSKKGGEAAIVIQRDPAGHVQMFPNLWNVANTPGFGNAMFAIRRAMRVEELRLKGATIPDEAMLSKEGSLDACPEWYALADGVLLNGSKKAPHVPPTKLPLEQIMEIVGVVLNPNRWEKHHKADCEKGVCTHDEKRPCLLHAWGLARCRNRQASPATDAFHAAEQAKNFAKLGLGRPTRR